MKFGSFVAGRVTRERPRIIYIVTAIESADLLLKGQLAFLRNLGFDVELICGSVGDGSELGAIALREDILVHFIPMARGISIVSDAKSLASLVRLLRLRQPDLVNVSTPKAGLLGGLASVLTGVPRRVYLLRGLRVETMQGWRRSLLLALEAVSCQCAHHVVCVSPSLRAKLVALRLSKPHRTVVLGSGASNGVDMDQFRATPERLTRARILRLSLGLTDETFVVGFVGRLVRDKGVAELVEAFLQLLKTDDGTLTPSHLIVVGQFEENDRIDETTRLVLETHPSISLLPWSDPALWYLVMDIVVLPTYREGFPNVPLEAGAAGRPVVTTNATGAVDSIVDGVTGILVPCGDVKALESSMRMLRKAPEFRLRLGEGGRQRAAESFTNEHVWASTSAFYRILLTQATSRTSDGVA